MSDHGIFLAILTLALAGCGGKAYVYEPVDTARFMPTVEQQSDGPISVSTSVPGREETARIFGIDLYAQGIQPVWLQIENTGNGLARYAPVSTDPEYFAPLEVAYTNRSGFSKQALWSHRRALPRSRHAPLCRCRRIPFGFCFYPCRSGCQGFQRRCVCRWRNAQLHVFAARAGVRAGLRAKLNLREMHTGEECPGLRVGCAPGGDTNPAVL